MRFNEDTFVTADLHLGHKNIVEYEHRPFDYEERIVSTWNRHVGKRDEVLILGDLSLGSKEYTKGQMTELNGRKYLILGNHDSHSLTWYEDCGVSVIPTALQTFETPWGQLRVIFSHEPIDPLSNDWFNIHGHVHARDLNYTERHCNVGVDVTHYIPVKISEVLALWKGMSSIVADDKTRNKE